MSDTPPFVALSDVQTVLTNLTDNTRFACALGVTTWGAIRAALQAPIDDAVASAIAAKLTEINTAVADAQAAAEDADGKLWEIENIHEAILAAAEAVESDRSAAEQANSAAQLALSDTLDARDDTQAARDEANDARDQAQDAADAWTSSAVYQGVWTASTAPVSPSRGDWWWVQTLATWGGQTWAVGDAAIYNGSAWQKLPLDTLLTAEKQARRQADLARWPWADFGSGIKGITKPLQSFSAPLTILYGYDVAAWPTTGTLGFLNAFFVKTGQSNNAGWATFGIFVSYIIDSLVFAVSDANYATNPNSVGRSDVKFPKSFLPTGRHTLGIRLKDTWRNGSVGALDTGLFIDGQVMATQGNINYATATTFDYSFQGNGEKLPLAIHGGGNYYSDAGAVQPYKLARPMIIRAYLPATRAEDQALASPLGYSIEQYDAGEEPPASLPVIYLDKQSGPQWRDSSPNRTHAVIEATPAQLNATAITTDTLSWAGNHEPKAFLTSAAAVIPAHTCARIRAKASAAMTVDITDGTTTQATMTFASAGWQEAVITTGAAAQSLLFDPTANYTGTLQVQVQLTPIN